MRICWPPWDRQLLASATADSPWGAWDSPEKVRDDLSGSIGDRRGMVGLLSQCLRRRPAYRFRPRESQQDVIEAEKSRLTEPAGQRLPLRLPPLFGERRAIQSTEAEAFSSTKSQEALLDLSVRLKTLANRLFGLIEDRFRLPAVQFLLGFIVGVRNRFGQAVDQA